MHLVVCYDVVSNSRRRKLRGKLKGMLESVQKSVFEGQLPESRYDDLIARINKCIDRGTDTVRVYRVCGRCRTLSELIGTAHVVPDGPTDEVI